MGRILIVEDYSDTREVTELILVEAGHTVVCAQNGLAGFQRAVQEQPDLILMDLNLPQLDGWEATRRLKANPATRDIPVIAFTAYIADDAIRRAMEAGCMASIIKPFDIDTLLCEVKSVLAGRGAPQQRRAVSGA